MRKQTRERRQEWLIIIGIAVLLHLVVFLTVKPEFFAMFQNSAAGGGGQVPAVASMPDAIITLEIEIDDNPDEVVKPVTDPGESEQPSDEPYERPAEDVRKKPRPDDPAEKDGPSDGLAAVDIETLIGDDPATVPYDQAGDLEVKLPPRPVEITWPDTDDLERCLGHEVNVRILVDEHGTIERVEPGDGNHPAACIEAALHSARRIRFEPGSVNGVPVKMWTQIRIDFREKD